MRLVKSYQQGMTLVEVLVAMAILTGIAGSVMLMTAQSARLGVSVQQKAIAQVVADNTMITILAKNATPEEQKIEVLDYAGQDWRVSQNVQEAGIAGLLIVSVSVSTSNSNQVLARIETLRAQQ